MKVAQLVFIYYLLPRKAKMLSVALVELIIFYKQYFNNLIVVRMWFIGVTVQLDS